MDDDEWVDLYDAANLILDFDKHLIRSDFKI